MSKKIIMLGSDTPHRRYFIKKLLAAGIPISSVVFESNSIQPTFPIGPFLKEEEDQFEADNYFRDFDSELGSIEVVYVPTINSPESEAFIRSQDADLALVFGTRKVANRIVRLFKDQAINVHRGIAEEYRGLDSNLWAVYHSDFRNIGVTIHRIDDSLDTGEIIYQESLQLPDGIEVHQMRYYETVQAADLIINTLQAYLTGTLKSRPQVKTGRYYSFIPLVLKELLPARLAKYNYE
jgi:methionyl-tRNA formyltransferase